MDERRQHQLLGNPTETKLDKVLDKETCLQQAFLVNMTIETTRGEKNKFGFVYTLIFVRSLVLAFFQSDSPVFKLNVTGIDN